MLSQSGTRVDKSEEYISCKEFYKKHQGTVHYAKLRTKKLPQKRSFQLFEVKHELR